MPGIVGVAPTAKFYWPIQTDFYIRFRLKNASTKALVSGATVTAQFYDAAENEIGSQITGNGVSGLSGYYELTVPLPILQPTKGEEYELLITATSTGKSTVSLKGKARYSDVLERIDTVITIIG